MEIDIAVYDPTNKKLLSRKCRSLMKDADSIQS